MSVLLKVLYLVTGLSLKEAVDAAKAQWKRKIERLERDREIIETYHPNPALEAGSPEAHRAIMKARHAAEVAPEVKKITGRIRRLHWLPCIAWCVIFLASFGATVYLELQLR